MASNSTEPLNDPKATPVSRAAENAGAARSNGVWIILSVFGSALTVSVALAALILTTANDTRRQFDERIELTRRHSDLQFTQLREDLREVREDFSELREDLSELRGDVREVAGEVRALAGRVAYLEGLLFPVRQSGLAPPSGTRGAGPATSPVEVPGSD